MPLYLNKREPLQTHKNLHNSESGQSLLSEFDFGPRFEEGVAECDEAFFLGGGHDRDSIFKVRREAVALLNLHTITFILKRPFFQNSQRRHIYYVAEKQKMIETAKNLEIS